MAEPTAAELDGFATLGDAAGWSGVSEAGLLLFEASFGAPRESTLRGIGSATEAEFNGQLELIRTADGAALTFLMKQTIRLLRLQAVYWLGAHAR